jgi:maleylacetate reductase
MLYVIHGFDKPRSSIRNRLIGEHHAYLAASGLCIVGSGPLMDDPDETPIGTVIIADCASRTEAARIMAAEPFNRAGLFESLHITRWTMHGAAPDNFLWRHQAGKGPRNGRGIGSGIGLGHTAPWRSVRTAMEPFELKVNPARIVFGAGAIGRTGEMIRQLGCSRALILSTPHQKAEAERLAASLGDLVAGVYANATMHTPVEVTEDALASFRETGADCTVAFGGGSTTGLGKALAYRTDLPQIAIPTTYAGSEVTPILGQTEAGRKTTVSDAKILPEVVIYDPELTYRLPAAMTVTSALNAMAHAAEALYARDRNPISSLMAAEGLRALIVALPVLRETPADPGGRAGALYGAWLCGTVLGSVGMALHHKLCHVLGGTFDLPHAETHAVILPHAVAFNEAAVPDLLSPLAKALGTERAGQGLHAYAASIGAPMTLKELGMPEDGIDRAADQAVANPYWNPRAFDRADIRKLIENAYHGRPPE